MVDQQTMSLIIQGKETLWAADGYDRCRRLIAECLALIKDDCPPVAQAAIPAAVNSVEPVTS